MTSAGAASAVSQMTAAYEALRAAVLTGRSRGQHGLAILVHRGLAAWVGELQREAPAAMPLPTSAPATAPTTPPTELTRVLAGIIVALTTGGTHAHA